jgi:hypothetical protein
MSAYRLYDTWIRMIRKLLPEERITRARNVAWMIVGLYLGQSVHLSAIARRLPFVAKLTSTTTRFRRFLNSEAFQVRVWYRQSAERLLAEATRGGLVRLILDSSKVGRGHQLLIVALAFRKRALPLAWTWVKSSRGHSTTRKQLGLLRYVHALMPIQGPVVLVGDAEFGAVAVARQVETWQWGYVLHQKGDTRVCVSRTALVWRHFITLVRGRDELAWYDRAIVTIKHLYHAKLLAYREMGQQEPWLLMTNLGDARATLHAYRRRMWIEEMFGDWRPWRRCRKDPSAMRRAPFSTRLSGSPLVPLAGHSWRSGDQIRPPPSGRPPRSSRSEPLPHRALYR